MYELSSGYLRGIFGIKAVEFLVPNKRQINWLQRYEKRFDYANKKRKKRYICIFCGAPQVRVFGILREMRKKIW